MQPKDIEVYSIKDNANKTLEQSQITVKCYGLDGTAYPNKDKLEVCATHTFSPAGEKFHVKVHPNGLLFNPVSTLRLRRKKEDVNFREVSRQTFDYYMQYLRSRNPLHFRHAARELTNG